MKRTITTILATALALVMVISLTACGGSGEQKDTSKDTSTTETIENAIIGSWKIESGKSMGNEYITFYEGGTGKATNSSLEDGSYYPFTWEIKGNIVNLTEELNGGTTTGLKYENDKLVGVDENKATYIRGEAPTKSEEKLITGTLIAKNTMHPDDWDVQIGNDTVTTRVSFADGEDVSALRAGDTIKFTGEKDSNDNYYNARLVN